MPYFKDPYDDIYHDADGASRHTRLCDHLGCDEEGLYPAPKSRVNLQERFYFCLDHVREYNKRWNYFSGYSQDQIYEQMRRDTEWDRPTWPSSIPQKMEERLHDFVRKFAGKSKAHDTHYTDTPLTKEAKALETLGLDMHADQVRIKARYRELVKKYHPDTNPDNPKAVERFKIVSEAYMILRSQWQTKG